MWLFLSTCQCSVLWILPPDFMLYSLIHSFLFSHLIEEDSVGSPNLGPSRISALFALLLGTQMVDVAILLVAINCTGVQTCIVLMADCGSCISGWAHQGYLSDATMQVQYQVQSVLFLDVVVRQGGAILQLLVSNISHCWLCGMSSLSSILGLTFFLVSLSSTLRVMVFPIRVLMKIGMSVDWPPCWKASHSFFYSLRQESGDKNWNKDHRGMIVTSLLPLAYSATSLI